MAIRKFRPVSPDPSINKIKGDTEFARLGHLNRLVDDINNTNIVGPQGAQGVQGPIGPQGVPGPVGPAGLNWQGAWVSGDPYVADDAVGYGGASYFCILATSGTTAPDVDTTHWALLASQGAIGPAGATGAQGPQGIQGIQGPSGAGTYKVYTIKADLFNITTPTVLENTTGLTITCSRPAGLDNYIRLTSSFGAFPAAKVFLQASSFIDAAGDAYFVGFNNIIGFGNTIDCVFKKHDNTVPGYIPNAKVFIEVRIYP